ncbi:MAG: DUF1674 domain-containing protein [Gammaproteobacteria bacterium]|nr:DUF1674 domain-containing protein [Gammaproteobacteria bacterium]
MQKIEELSSAQPETAVDDPAGSAEARDQSQRPKEYGGPKGKEPTRYGDWEKNGRCIDF